MLYNKLKKILLPSEVLRMLMLTFFMLIAMLLEVIGIGMVIPAIAIITTSDISSRYPILNPLLAYLGNPPQEQLVIWGMMMLGSVYLIKTIFLITMIGYQNKFIFSVQASLSKRLFSVYIHQPWCFYLMRNSAQLIASATTEVSMFISNALQPFTALLSEGLALIGIVALLMFFNPLGTSVTIMVLACFLFIFQSLVRHRVLSWGSARQRYEKGRILNLQQGISSIKDVKVLGREGAFLKRYNIDNEGYAFVARKQKTLLELPRLLIELLAVVGLVILTLMMIFQGKTMAVLLPTLGLFAAAAFRSMPALNRIIGAIQSLRYGIPVIEHLLHELNLSSQKNNSKASPFFFNKKLVLSNINYSYPNSEESVLKNINLTITRGTSVGFIGRSGSGKSTLIDIILGLLVPTDGTVKCDDVDVQSNLRGWQNQIGYVGQSIYLTDDTLRQNIAFGIPESEINEVKIDKALKAAQLDDFVMSLAKGLDTVVGERGICLSGGQKQRIGIARALYHDPAVLILDEATSALDSETESKVMLCLNNLCKTKTILIIAHRLSTLSNCDWVYKMEKGCIIRQGVLNDLIVCEEN